MLRSFRLSALALVLAVLALPAARASAATASVAPADTTIGQGDVIQLRVVGDAFADLKGYQLVFSFDPSRLQFLGALPGDVLTGTGRAFTTFVLPDAVPPVDSVWMDAAVLDGSTSAPGVLAYFQFAALALGQSPLTCLHVEYRNSANAPTLPECVSGVVHILGPTPVTPPSWGRLKVRYR